MFFDAVLIILFLIVLNGYLKRNRQVPGPFPLPLIGGAYVFFGYLTAEKILLKWSELLKKYKGTFSVWLGNMELIVISKPEQVQVYCTSPHLLDHAPFYDNFNCALTGGLFVANGAAWKMERKAWTPSFHPTVIRTFVKTFKDHAEIFVKKLEEAANGTEFPFYPYTRDYFFNTILLTQVEYDHDKQSKFRNLNEVVEPFSEIMYQKFFNIFYHSDTIFKLSASGRKVKELMDYIRNYVTMAVENKKVEYANEGELADDDVRRNLFSRQLLNVRKASMETMQDELITLAMTGYETTSHVMGFITIMLGKHQDVQERVFLEDQEIQKNLNGHELTMDDLDKYEYLDRVIKETLRLFPVAPIMGRKAAKEVKMGDLTIPKGSSVISFTYALHRDPEIYPNPLEFNPDNFLPERVAERHPYSYVAFSAGPRNCIGIKFAMTSLKVIVSALVRNYRLFSNRNVEDIKLTSKLVLGDAENFLLRIEKR